MAKLSSIASASANPALTDQVVGVGGGTTDYLYSVSQLSAAMSPTPPNTQTGTSYTLALTDLGGIVEMSNTSSCTVTIANNATVNFPVGATIDVVQFNTGSVTIANAAGVTILYNGSLTVPAQYYSVTLYQHANNTWVLLL